MHRAFKLHSVEFHTDFSTTGSKLNEKNAKIVGDTLGAFISGGEIDGSQLRDFWFPKIKADVFISHSHNDEALALNLAGWLLNQFNLVSFIDSCVWGYADDLLQEIDDKYCRQPTTNTYNYKKRNGSTSHVHMMLSTALSGMIDAAECIIFVSTPSSVETIESISKVASPWIFNELAMIELIRKRPLEDYRLLKEAKNYQFSKSDERLPILYTANFDSLTEIDGNTLSNWETKWAKNQPTPKFALDLLYELAPHNSNLNSRGK